MDPAGGLAEKFWDLVLGLIWKQLRYLVCYGQNIEQLHERLEELTLERSSIQHRIDEATNIADQEIDEKVVRWMDKVDEISEQVQKLHHESQGKRECSITSCPNPWLRYKLSKRAKAMAQQVTDIRVEGDFDRVSYRVPPKWLPELTNGESNEGIDSRVPIMNQIMEALRNPSVNMIGLCGLGGVGKTTIAKEVARANNQNWFEKVIMVTVSQEWNIERIQRQIAEKLGIQINETIEDVIASRLFERLKQKKMLLILDDLWEELDLGKVGIPLIEGCKILLTSRNDTLLSNSMKCQKIIKVGVLSEDEALELFKKIAELPIDSSSSDLMSIATEIVQKCGGLPLAIATAAKALRGKDLNEWKDYRRRLNNPLRRNVTGIKEVDAVLKVSVDVLSPEKKYIFLLTSMLTHDPLIEELLMYTVGLDILEGIDNMKEAHEGIFAIVNKLKSSDLFLDSFSSDRVTVHDVLRDVALSIAPKELHAFVCRGLKEWPDKNILAGYKVICSQESDISGLPEELHGPELEFFLLNSTKRDLTIPSMFFKSSKELNVLTLTNVQFPSLRSLSFLQKLKALCLHSCSLEDITEVGSLKMLKVLSLAYSEIQQLPIELAELTSLQMLNLSYCSKLRVIPPKILCSLKKLEVLSMENSFSPWKVEGSSEANENASLDELKGLPIYSLDIHIPNVSMLPEDLFLDMNLERYKIFIGEHWEWWEVNDKTSKTLKLEIESYMNLKPGVRKLLQGVEDLSLYGSNASNEVFRSLFNSKVLLPKIEILELSNLSHWIPLIWDEQLSDNSFSNLKTLTVERCGFVKLVPLHVMKSLNNLEELEVEDCEKLEMVFDFEDLNDYKGMESSSVVVPLKKLKLWRLPKLKNVWSDDPQGIVSFPSLWSVDVSNCESLTSMFPASIAKGMLRHLEDLRISYCGIDVIVAKDQVSESVDAAFEFPRPTSLTLDSLPNLSNFYPRRYTLKWPHLQRLSIEDCDELEIFEKKVSSSSEIHEEESALNSKYPLLPYEVIHHNLEELTLRGKQVEIIGSGQFSMYHFPKVKLLYISVEEATTISYELLLRSFPNLERLQLDGDFEETSGGDDVAALAPRLSTFTLSPISNMISLAPSLLSSPNLTHLQVQQCDRLTILMTSSVAQCMVHLMHLSISYCHQIEEIITKQEGEDDDDREIIFNKLKSLELGDLPRLKRFCGHYTFKFPFLDQLTITRCPKFKTFSPGTIDTPSLKRVQLSQGWGEHREIWDTNLNKTVYQERFMASRELVLDEDDAILIRNIDQFLADPYPEVEILCIERIVDEGLTIPYALLERFPQLKALRVERCSFGEIFPSHVPPSSALFHNLRELKVSECHQLVYLVTNSTAKCLGNLETLEIDDCGKMEEIVRKESNEDVEGGITFNGLRIIKLADLPRLKLEDEDKRDLNVEDRATNGGCRSLFGHNTVIHHNLEELTLNGEQAEMIGSGQFPMYHFPNVEPLHLSIKKTPTISYASLLRSFPNLESLQLGGDFEETSGGDGVAALAPRLSTFTIKSISNMISLAPSLLSSPNLTHLQVEFCNRLTILMTSSVARCLVHLTHLSISYCNQIEEIITKQEGEDDDDQEIVFSKLKSLKLGDLPRLKRFCGHDYTFKFPFLDQLTITGCPKFKTFSPGTIDSPSLKSVQLSEGWGEHREIWDTNLNKTVYQQRFWESREVVLDEDDAIMICNIDQFPAEPYPQVEILSIKRIVDEGLTILYALLERFPQLKALRVERCSFGEIFPSHVPPSSALFHNLRELKVSECHQLVYLVTNSTAKCLANLETLEIDDCEKMEEIVRKESNEDVEGGIPFNGLRILKLADLPRLKIEDEDKRDLNIEDMATNDGCRSLFGHNTVIHHNLEELTLRGKQVEMIGSDLFRIYHFPKVKLLHLSVEEATTISYASLLRSFTNLERLQLRGDFEETSGGDDVAALAPRLSTFTLYSISNMISLAPSLLSSPNLTHLQVNWCDRLTILMMSSVARCLIHLTHLSISNCNQIEEIITKQEGEDDEDKEISFSKLKSLKLVGLRRLKRFCGHNCTFKFPLLKSVIITECPQLVKFCPGVIHAPLLESVQVDEYEPHANIWKNDLNTTIQHQFAFKEVISTTTIVALNAKNITVITDVFPQVSTFYVESFQDEGVNFPYSSLERFPKLEGLYVEHCSFEEVFPSHDQIVDFVGKVPPFKDLHIAHLDQLKCIWNDDSQLPPIHQNLEYLRVKSCCNLVKLAPSSASFQNLWELSVSGCHQLIHLVTPSTAKSLVSLVRLEINDCKKMEEIVMNETNEDVQGAITFNRLWSIELTDMPSLKMFSSQSHNFELPKLKEIKITGCPEMKMFCQGVLKTPKLSRVKIEDHDMEWKDGGDLNKTIETLS